MSDIAARLDRLQVSIDVARKLEALLDDDVRNFFAATEAQLTAEMIAAGVEDDAERRHLAMMIRLVRDLKFWISEQVQQGRIAGAEVEQLRRRDHA